VGFVSRREGLLGRTRLAREEPSVEAGLTRLGDAGLQNRNVRFRG
jgi:hypothetical protein